MKITNIYCDGCGKLIPEGARQIDGLDFCPECWKKVIVVVRHLADGMMAAQPDEPDPEPEPEKPEKPEEPKKRATVDKGKAQALRDAGWTLQQIADELHSHPSYISRITTAPEPKAAKPLEWTGKEEG